jgi:hypothetical protein
MKSHGRAPTFLLLTGYEQVCSVAATLSGDMEAACTVQLVLPDTGACSLSDGEQQAQRGGLSVEAGKAAEAAACCG